MLPVEKILVGKILEQKILEQKILVGKIPEQKILEQKIPELKIQLGCHRKSSIPISRDHKSGGVLYKYRRRLHYFGIDKSFCNTDKDQDMDQDYIGLSQCSDHKLVYRIHTYYHNCDTSMTGLRGNDHSSLDLVVVVKPLDVVELLDLVRC